jgi:putative heme iron utilization protein
MTPDNRFDPRKAAKKLLREGLTGALATLMADSGAPYCSLVNVATAHDGAPLLLLSKLAVHTKNLLADPRASLMLDERKEGDPLEGARVMLMGPVTATDDRQARARYLARHPEAEQFAGFADFAIYRMQIERAHLVAGFGRIVDLAGKDILTDLAGAEPLIEAEAEAVAHMNSDHADALNLYATRLLGARAGAWRCTGCDPDGLDMRLGRTGLRLFFSQRVAAPGPLRTTLKELADSARTR